MSALSAAALLFSCVNCIKLALESSQPMSAITEKFAKTYDEDTGALGVLTPTHQPRATENVPGMIALTIAAMGDLCTRGPFWALPPRFLHGGALRPARG